MAIVKSKLLKTISNNYPNLVNLNEIISSDEKYEDQSSITFESNSCIYPIHNFYMSDIISKNSKTMAKCVEDILSNVLPDELSPRDALALIYKLKENLEK